MDQRITKIVSDFNEETNAISARIDRLIESGNSGASVEEIVEALTPISNRLKALGQDATDPIPEDPNPPVEGGLG